MLPRAANGPYGSPSELPFGGTSRSARSELMKRKVRVVTRSSFGVGAAVARLFAGNGRNIVVNYCNQNTVSVSAIVL